MSERRFRWSDRNLKVRMFMVRYYIEFSSRFTIQLGVGSCLIYIYMVFYALK